MDTDPPVTTNHISVWHDPLAADGLKSDSDDALVYLTPILGPTSTLLLHRLARCLTTNSATVWSTDDLAASFGVAPAVIRSSLARLERFAMIRHHASRTEVRTIIPALSARHIARLPEYLAIACPYRLKTTSGHAA
jgi:hypothetical protein